MTPQEDARDIIDLWKYEHSAVSGGLSDRSYEGLLFLISRSISQKQAVIDVLKRSLELIAAPIRADGTYNRCREACEQVAVEALALAKIQGEKP